ncbi:MAG: hypothetical protein MJB57_11585 [Gemmatimonadetes bacterium]|nr:hypothetical protein [Gemmatimonadota bacterium]
MTVMLFVPLLAAATMVVLAIWLARIAKGREASHAFAMVLWSRAVSLVGLTILFIATSPFMVMLGGALYPAGAFLAALGTVYFTAVYPRRWARLPRATPALILVFTAALAGAFVLWPSLIIPPGMPADLSPGGKVSWFLSRPRTPFGLSPVLLDVTLTIPAFLLAREASAARNGRKRKTLRLVSLGFFAPAACSCMVAGLLLQIRGLTPSPTDPSLFNRVEMGLFGLWFVAILALCAYFLWKRDTLFVGVVIVSVLIGGSTALTDDLSLSVSSINAMLGAWSTLGAILVAIGVLRYDLFDLDDKVKLAVRRGTVGAIFAGAFFAGSELLEGLVPVEGTILGLAAAGAVVLVLRPVQRLVERLTDRWMGPAKPIDGLDEDAKREIYRQQLDLLTVDGHLSERDKAVLENLSAQLGIDPASPANPQPDR